MKEAGSSSSSGTAAVASWLEAVKPGYGRYAAAFAASGVEDLADLQTLAREPLILREVEAAMVARLGAKKMHLRNVRLALGVERPLTERSEEPTDRSRSAHAASPTSRSASPDKKRVTFQRCGGGAATARSPRREPLRRLRAATQAVILHNRAAARCPIDAPPPAFIPLAALSGRLLARLDDVDEELLAACASRGRAGGELEQQGGAEPEEQQGTLPPRGDEEQGPKRHCAASTSAAAAPLDMEPLAC